MADDVEVTAGSGTSIAADEIAGVKHQRVKVQHGVDGAAVDTSATNPLPVDLGDVTAGEYETVAASATAQVLGSTGAIGDYIAGLLVIPTSTSPGVVTLIDNATSIPVFAGGASSLSNLVPFFIPLGMFSVSGAWKITTGSGLSVIATGNFT